MAILAERLFSFYHAQELAASPEIFLAGVVELFCKYPHEVVLRAVSPVLGLPRKHKFPPRLAEIAEFLDQESLIWEKQNREVPKMLPVPRKPRPPLQPGQYTWGQIEEMRARGELKGRPRGRFE